MGSNLVSNSEHPEVELTLQIYIATFLFDG